jgi:hypothetical protein
MWWLTSRRKLMPLMGVNDTHHTLTSRHQPRLRHNTRRAVLVLVGHLSTQPLLTLSLEAKLSKVPIPPTMLTIEGFWFWLWFWALFGLWLFLTRFLSLLPKKLIPQVTLELDGFLDVISMWRKHG